MNKFSIDILYKDEHIVIISKPSGLLTVGFPGFKGKTAESILENIMRKDGSWKKNHKPFAVHRLDRDTSGVMMFALTENAQKIFSDNWHKIVTSRKYIAVAENPSTKINIADKGLIDKPLAQNQYNQSYVPLTKTDKHGKIIPTVKARTNYEILHRGKKFTMFQLELDTGKKNQIRAHLAFLGYPLCGDENYRAKTNPFNRLALHARTISFTHPFTKEKMSFEVPEPKNWLPTVKG